jgi:hypothetical protein
MLTLYLLVYLLVYYLLLLHVSKSPKRVGMLTRSVCRAVWANNTLERRHYVAKRLARRCQTRTCTTLRRLAHTERHSWQRRHKLHL